MMHLESVSGRTSFYAHDILPGETRAFYVLGTMNKLFPVFRHSAFLCHGATDAKIIL